MHVAFNESKNSFSRLWNLPCPCVKILGGKCKILTRCHGYVHWLIVVILCYRMFGYFDDLLNTDNTYFDGLISQIYPPELQLNKAYSSATEAAFLDLHLSVVDGFVSCKFYDKRDDFDFEIVNFPFLDGDVPRAASYGVYISQLIRFARVSSHVTDFNTRNKLLTAKLLNRGYRYHKLHKAFSKFYRRHSDLVSKFNVGLKSLLQQGLSEPEIYGT